MDKARPVAEKALGQIRRGLAQGQAKVHELGERRREDKLLRDLGEAVYAEHRSEGDHARVTRALAALDAHRESHPAAPDAPDSPPPEAMSAGSPSSDAPTGETPSETPSMTPDAPSTPTATERPGDTKDSESGPDEPPTTTPPV